MYYDRIGQVLQESRKIIIDPTCGVPELWMNFSGIKEDKDIIKKQEDLNELIKISRKKPFIPKEYSSNYDGIQKIKRQIENRY